MSAASVRFDHDAQWVEVDLSAEPRAWAAATVGRRWAAQRLNDDPARAEVITASIARVVTSLGVAELAAALLLYPPTNPWRQWSGCGASPHHPGSPCTRWARS